MKRITMVALLVGLALALAAAASAQAANVACAQDYTVLADDWLSKLADKYLGDGQLYWAIVDATNAAGGDYAKIADPDRIEAGWKVCIPSAADARQLMAAHDGTPAGAAPAKAYAPVIDPANFVQGINNPYFPLQPGKVFVYEGKTESGDEHNEVYVTSETKVIMGVTCTVVSDTVKVDGELEEATFDWYAQDQQGNVWYFGEDSKEYEDGQVVSTAGSWEAGVDGALPGIIMPATPAPGAPYRQEYYKGEAEDMAQVMSLSESASVPQGTYDNVLTTKEWSALDKQPVIEYKYYAKDIGFIMVKEGQTGGLQLVEIREQQQQGTEAGNEGDNGADEGDEGD